MVNGFGGPAVLAIAYNDVAAWYSAAAWVGLLSASTCAARANAADTRPARFGLTLAPAAAAWNTGRWAAAYRSADAVSPSSFCGSRHRSWSPVKLPAALPEPMPTWRYRVFVVWFHIRFSHASPKCASLSNVDGDEPRSARSLANSNASPYAVVWVNFR